MVSGCTHHRKDDTRLAGSAAPFLNMLTVLAPVADGVGVACPRPYLRWHWHGVVLALAVALAPALLALAPALCRDLKATSVQVPALVYPVVVPLVPLVPVVYQ